MLRKNVCGHCTSLVQIPPQTLLNTMVYMCGLYFALGSSQECHSLSDNQIKLVEPVHGISHLIYTENISKKNPGGLHNSKLKPITVILHANMKELSRCFVMFYKAYMTHRPKDVTHDAFYQFVTPQLTSGIHPFP